MFINSVGHYIPSNKISNDYFADINGLTNDWIVQRTGIHTRSRATAKETINYMCIKAVEEAMQGLPYCIEDVDLIIFASYTPSDTIATTGHVVQREYNITKAKVFYLSSACSSAMNALEVIKSFFQTKIATKALLICADRNSSYSDDTDCMSGHLWGDAAVAYFMSGEAIGADEPEVTAITTQGLAHIGTGTKSVFLDPLEGGLQMPFGKDVFMHACTYIAQNTKDIVQNNGHSLQDLSYFIGHQANMRIIKNVAKQLDLPEEKLLTNIAELGNTGCASAMLVFTQNKNKFVAGDLICISVFGGGYSAGTCLISYK